MKFFTALIALFALSFSTFAVNAESCQYTFRCQGSICERAPSSSCSPTPSNVVIHATSSATPLIGSTTDAPSNQLAAPSSGISKNQETPQTPLNGFGCAENGSCYGDVSYTNGMPKTTHVDGYFRSNGTYVRGHYRSTGKR